MIAFDPKKVKYEYVFINSVGRNSIKVVAGGDSQPYRNDFNVAGRYIKKTGEFIMKAHQSVTAAFLSIYRAKHFKTKKACVFIYDGDVLFFDCGYESYSYDDGLYKVDSRFRKYNPDNGWVSSNIEAMERVGETIAARSVDGVCILDGSNLIIRKKDAEKVPFLGDSKINIESVYFLDLSKLVRRTSDAYMKNIVRKYSNIFNINKENGQVFTVDKDDIDDVDSLAYSGSSAELGDGKTTESKKEDLDRKKIVDMFNLKAGLILTFNYGENGEESGISPIISVGNVGGFGKFDVTADLFTQYKLFTNKKIDNNKSSLKTNLHYVITAAKVVAKHYGYDKTDFLNLPDVIDRVGTINLVADIEFKDRIQTVVGISPFSALSYICGFIERENRLEVVRDLRTAFLSIIRYGFFYGDVSDCKLLLERDIPLFDISKVPDINFEEFSSGELLLDMKL